MRSGRTSTGGTHSSGSPNSAHGIGRPAFHGGSVSGLGSAVNKPLRTASGLGGSGSVRAANHTSAFRAPPLPAAATLPGARPYRPPSGDGFRPLLAHARVTGFQPLGGVWPRYGPCYYAGRWWAGAFGPFGVGCPLYGYGPNGLYYGAGVDPALVLSKFAAGPRPVRVSTSIMPHALGAGAADAGDDDDEQTCSEECACCCQACDTSLCPWCCLPAPSSHVAWQRRRWVSRVVTLLQAVFAVVWCVVAFALAHAQVQSDASYPLAVGHQRLFAVATADAVWATELRLTEQSTPAPGAAVAWYVTDSAAAPAIQPPSSSPSATVSQPLDALASGAHAASAFPLTASSWVHASLTLSAAADVLVIVGDSAYSAWAANGDRSVALLLQTNVTEWSHTLTAATTDSVYWVVDNRDAAAVLVSGTRNFEVHFATYDTNAMRFAGSGTAVVSAARSQWVVAAAPSGAVSSGSERYSLGIGRALRAPYRPGPAVAILFGGLLGLLLIGVAGVVLAEWCVDAPAHDLASLTAAHPTDVPVGAPNAAPHAAPHFAPRKPSPRDANAHAAAASAPAAADWLTLEPPAASTAVVATPPPARPAALRKEGSGSGSSARGSSARGVGAGVSAGGVPSAIAIPSAQHHHSRSNSGAPSGVPSGVPSAVPSAAPSAGPASAGGFTGRQSPTLSSVNRVPSHLPDMDQPLTSAGTAGRVLPLVIQRSPPPPLALQLPIAAEAADAPPAASSLPGQPLDHVAVPIRSHAAPAAIELPGNGTVRPLDR